MIRIIGITLLLIMSILTGSWAAQGLKARLDDLRAVRHMLEAIRLMIRYEALEVTEIADRLADNNEVSRLSFIGAVGELCREAVEKGELSFYEAWDKAVSDNHGSLTDADISVLSRAGHILGTCDCEGQLSAIALLCNEADKLIEEAKEQYIAKGKLYRALGAVAGALLAVIAI